MEKATKLQERVIQKVPLQSRPTLWYLLLFNHDHELCVSYVLRYVLF